MLKKGRWIVRIRRRLGLARSARALQSRPAWFDATYLSPTVDPEPEPQPVEAPAAHDPAPARAYGERERAAVWQKGRPIIGWDPQDWRVDHRGNTIFRHHYGDADSAFGWDIERIHIQAGDELDNLRPLLCHEPERTFRFETALDPDRSA